MAYKLGLLRRCEDHLRWVAVKVCQGPVQDSVSDRLEWGEVSMMIVGMVARSPKPGILPKAELTPPIAELRVF